MCRYSLYFFFSLAFSSSGFSAESEGIDLNLSGSFVTNHETGAQTYSGELADSFEKLSSRPDLFKPVTKEMSSWYNPDAQAFWLKIRITSFDQRHKWNVREKIQLNAWDYANLYSTCETSQPQKSGLMVPLKNRSVQKGVLVFRLPDCSHPYDIYIQMISTHSVNADKTEYIIETENETDAWMEKHHYIQGIYLGIVAIMAIYNFFLFLSLRDKSYIYYVLFISAFGILWTTHFGISIEFFWPQASEWNVESTFYLTALSAFFGTLFVVHYFNTAQNLPFIHKLLVINCALYFVCIALGMFHVWALAQNLLAMVSMISVSIFIVASIRLMIAGYRPAYYLFFAWSILAIGVITYSLAFLGFISYNLFVSYGIEIGSVIEVGLLSFGLADRINIINKEKDEIKLAARENEFRLLVLKARNEAMEMDLDMAREIQESLIPQIRYPNIATLYLPMEKVGGDFFDIIPLDNDRTAVLLADVSGHGVPAALITALLKSWISNETEARKSGGQNSWLNEPEKFMLHINDVFSMDIYKRFLSAIYGIYDKRLNTFAWSSAAHPPLMIFHHEHSGELSQMTFLDMTPQGPPLGVFFNEKLKDRAYMAKSIQLKPGDRILLYSDGLMEEADYTYENKHQGLTSFQGNPLYDKLRDFANLDINQGMENIKIFLANLHSTRQRVDDICLVMIETCDLVNRGG